MRPKRNTATARHTKHIICLALALESRTSSSRSSSISINCLVITRAKVHRTHIHTNLLASFLWPISSVQRRVPLSAQLEHRFYVFQLEKVFFIPVFLYLKFRKRFDSFLSFVAITSKEERECSIYRIRFLNGCVSNKMFSRHHLSKQKQSVKWYKWIEFAWPSFPIGRVLVFWCGHSMYFSLSNHRLLSIIHFPYVKMRTPILEANSIEICSVMDTLIHDKWTPKTLIYAIDGGNIAYNTLCMWWRWADDYRFFVCFF